MQTITSIPVYAEHLDNKMPIVMLTVYQKELSELYQR